MRRDEAASKVTAALLRSTPEITWNSARCAAERNITALEALGLIKFEEPKVAQLLWCFPTRDGDTSPPICDQDLRMVLDDNGFSLVRKEPA